MLPWKGDGTLIKEKRTHPEKPTLGSNDTSPEAKQLVEDLQNILRCEEAWYVAEDHLNRVRKTIEEQYREILDEQAGRMANALSEITDALNP
jgi:hypothetical protein